MKLHRLLNQLEKQRIGLENLINQLKGVCNSSELITAISESEVVIPYSYNNWEQRQELDLSLTYLESLPSNIRQLNNLTSLNLHGNNLKTLPAEIGQLTNLTHLGLGENNLTKLPAEIGQLTQLTSLDPRSNPNLDWAETFNQLSSLSKLTSLNLRDNRLTKLPVEIGQLTQLTSLHLRGNNLTELPVEIGQLTNLTELDLYLNNLTKLPAEIGQLTQLISLDLRENNLTKLPAEIGQLTQLTSLDLNYNRLTELPVEIGQLTNLTNLVLEENTFKISNRKLSRFPDNFQLWRQQKIPVELRKLHIAFFFNGLNQVKPMAEQLTDEQLLNCLDGENTDISALILEILGQRSNPFAEPVNLSELVFHFAGHFTSISVKEMRAWLKAKGARVVSRLSKKVTHFVVGQGQGKLALGQLNLVTQLVFPSHLQQLMEKLDQPLLMQKTEEQSKLIDNLRQLLTSSDISNVKVGLMQMLGNGIPEKLMTTLVSFYLYHQEKEVRQIASQAFQKHASTELKVKIRSLWTTNMRSRKKVWERINDMKKICQDERLSATQMYIWVECLKDFHQDIIFSWQELEDKWHECMQNNKHRATWRLIKEMSEYRLSAAEMFVWVECLKEFGNNPDTLSMSELKNKYSYGSPLKFSLEELEDGWHDFSLQLNSVLPDAKIE